MAIALPQSEGADVLDHAIESPWRLVRRRFLRHRLAVASAIVLGTIILMTVFAPLISPYDPNRIELEKQNLPPSLANLMGTDRQGRDVFTRVLYAGRVSLGLAFSVVGLSMVIGIVVGVVSGFFGGWVDSVLMRITDFMLTLPELPILLVMSAILGRGNLIWLVIFLVVFGWMGIARLIRAQVLSLREQQFVEAARALGSSRSRTMFRHLVPNAIAPILVSATLAISGVVITEAALSFLGFGVQAPDASWGNMLQAVTLDSLESYPWQSFFPGLMIFLVSLCVNFLGDGLRDALDPRERL